jgi:hypothetical protein
VGWAAASKVLWVNSMAVLFCHLQIAWLKAALFPMQKCFLFAD